METLETNSKFTSFDDLLKAIENFGVETNSKYTIFESRPISDCPYVLHNKNLRFYSVRFCCSHQDPKILSVTKNKPSCPAEVFSRVEKTGDCLKVVKMIKKHNHRPESSKSPQKSKLVGNITTSSQKSNRLEVKNRFVLTKKVCDRLAELAANSDERLCTLRRLVDSWEDEIVDSEMDIECQSVKRRRLF